MVICLAALMLLTACDRGEAAHPDIPGAHAALAVVSASAVTAYRLGRRREIVLTEAALRLLRCAASADEHAVVRAAAESDRIAADGARAAGMATMEYQRMAVQVDSLLVARPGDGAGGNPGAGPSGGLRDDVAAQLDSLRVQLVVGKSRLAAETAQAFDARASHRGPC